MRLRTLTTAWNEAVFAPQGPEPLAIYRILFGLLVIGKLLLLLPDWLNWFGAHAMVSLDTMHKMEPGTRLDVFDVLPQNDIAIQAFFWVALLAAVLVTVGLLTRPSLFVVFLALVSIDERELYMMNAGDAFLRVAAFFLIFAPSDAAFSVDRLIRIWRGKEDPEHKPQVVWAQRMLQFVTALVYFSTAWWKSTGATWVNGTALYYVHHLDQFRRFPLPSWTDDPALVRVETWVGLAEEYALATLVWIKEFRYSVLAAGVVLHLVLEYSMNVPLFQWIMLAAFILFVDPADLTRVWEWLRSRISPVMGSSVRVAFSAKDGNPVRQVNVLRALDILKKVDFAEDRAAVAQYRVLTRIHSACWLVQTPQGFLSGAAAYRELGRAVPALFPFRFLPPGRPVAVANRAVAASSTAR